MSKVYFDKDNPMVGRIHVEDYPHIDWKTEDGQSELSALAFWARRQFPSLGHVLFTQNGETIGEWMDGGSPFEKGN